MNVDERAARDRFAQCETIERFDSNALPIIFPNLQFPASRDVQKLDAAAEAEIPATELQTREAKAPLQSSEECSGSAKVRFASWPGKECVLCCESQVSTTIVGIASPLPPRIAQAGRRAFLGRRPGEIGWHHVIE